MTRRRVYDQEGHAHFVTFSCYRRRRLLDHDQAKRIVLGVLSDQLGKQSRRCAGFVVMPDHVHAIVWFPKPHPLATFMKLWKQQSSLRIKRFMEDNLVAYAETIDMSEPVWQARYYDFNLYSEKKILEKLQTMHQNPVTAGLAARAVDWRWSSARYYEQGRSVGSQCRFSIWQRPPTWHSVKCHNPAAHPNGLRGLLQSPGDRSKKQQRETDARHEVFHGWTRWLIDRLHPR